MTQVAADVRRKLARYSAAFEAGELDASLVQSGLAEPPAENGGNLGPLGETSAAKPFPTGEPIEAALESWGLSRALG